MKNEIKNKNGFTISSSFQKFSKHPLFGYILLVMVLATVQLIFMFGDGFISLTVSKAISLTMIYAIAAIGLSVLIGMSGLISLGTASFIGLGAYIAGNILKYYLLPYSVILFVVAVAAVVIGIVVGFISLRAKNVQLLIITIALGSLLTEVFTRPNNFTGGASGMTKVPFPSLFGIIDLNRETVFFVVLAVLFLVIVLTMNLINSPTGIALMAMRNSESLAKAMGINVIKHRVLAFVVATEFAMIAGALYVSSIGAANPYTWTQTLSLNILAAVILGGHYKPIGAILGSFVIFCLDLAVLKNIAFFSKNSSASLIFTGVLIVLIVVKYPGGMMHLWIVFTNSIKKLFAKWRMYKYGPDKQIR